MLKRNGNTWLGKLLVPALIGAMLMAGCGNASGAGNDGAAASSAQSAGAVSTDSTAAEDTGSAKAPELPGLTFESELPIEHATMFRVYYYSDGFKLIDITDSGEFLLVPEGKEVPEELEAAMEDGTLGESAGAAADGDETTESGVLDGTLTVIRQPVDSVYQAASAGMSLIDAIDAMDHVSMCSVDENGWYIDAPRKALADGSISFGGKYSQPDYEMLIDKDCDLAIESTMILHAPDVMEMIEDLDIPVMIERSSYEMDPLGRTEWVKLYGALFNKEEEAAAFFEEKTASLKNLEGMKNSGKTVAFFAVNTNGTVVVRKSDDYIPHMIETAGGRYIFEDLKSEEGSASTTVNMSMEEFYAAAVDADYLVYNATIEDPLGSVDDLVAKDKIFAEFKAVQDGNVYQLSKAAYQATDAMADQILDLHDMLDGGDGGEYISKVGA
ncbi:MAG: ABC transporter substrate-binding protein [Eubacterium sp.]|nr:ABC transporter substrate-binding protein [Eubacterium sp.]